MDAVVAKGPKFCFMVLTSNKTCENNLRAFASSEFGIQAERLFFAKKVSFDEHVNKVGHYGYLGACNATLGKGFGQLGNQAVAFSTGYGDGLYPVYSNINEDGRITKVVIIFDEEDEY